MSSSAPNASALFGLRELGMAFRKTKADLFFSSRMCRRELLEFETRITANLKRLQNQLLAGLPPALPPQAWTVVPKSIPDPQDDYGLVDSDAASRWRAFRNQPDIPAADFRLMEALSIEFHVFATLWIHKVGHKFDERLSSNVLGNRLRRKLSGELNPLSLGSSPPYIHPYCKWRDDGMAAIRDALNNNRTVLAMTADVRSFYHRLDPRFMLNQEFIELIGVDLTQEERVLHALFIDSLVVWAQQTPLGRGLPVGLVASSIIANVALYEFDSIIQSQVIPLYYGRYVDDVILVMDDGANLRDSRAVWQWLSERSLQKLIPAAASDGEGSVYFRPSYLTQSNIEFSSSKTKFFRLRGPSGKAILASIEKQIQARASEWHALPELPREGAEIESNLLSAIQASGELADSLRKADGVSVRRAALSINLRDVEAYSRSLPPEAWADRRHSFLDAFVRNVVVLPSLFSFFNYVPRVIQLASGCADFVQLRAILDALERVLAELGSCRLKLNGAVALRPDLSSDEILARFREQLRDLVSQCIESSFRSPESSVQRDAWSAHFGETFPLLERKDLATLRKTHRNYLRHDLAHRPLKQALLPPELAIGTQVRLRKQTLAQLDITEARELVEGPAVASAQTLSSLAGIPDREKISTGILFPTRPPGIYELYLVHPDAFSPEGAKQIAECLLGLRGFTPEKRLPIRGGAQQNGPIVIPNSRKRPNPIRIAVASWKTDKNSWVAAVAQRPDPDSTRLDRLNRLLTAVIACPEKPDYLILPECSLPPSWFLGAAIRLQRKGISLIGGIEYQHAKRNIVHSQAWAALSHDALGFPTMMHYAQDKQRPAQHEESDLKRIAGRTLKPKSSWTIPPILDHGGFHFALLLCSELTNISYRAALRGQIDALFVPEWNQDTESFNALVESAALDIHAFIIQCNDRQYGDSRIRVPHKNSWQRDTVRVKGGVGDYFVVGEIDVLALRQFQSNFRSPEQPFKPVPDGFEISHRRKVLPKP